MGDITLRQALEEYEKIYMASRNFSQRTRVEYLNDLEDLIRFLEQLGLQEVRNIGLPQLERYLAELDRRGLAGTTRKRKVVSIRSFLGYLYQDGYISTNLARRLIPPFAEVNSPRYLTKLEYERLLVACAHNPRDFALIQLILQTGIKLSELVRLTKNDIELEETTETGEKNSWFIRILGGRGKKERMIPLNTKACLALKNYSDNSKETVSNILFLNRFSESLGERGVQKMLRKYLKRAGLHKAGVHTLRHTFGIHLLVKGTSLKTLKDVMGLKDIRSTDQYVSLANHLNVKKMQEKAL